MWELEKIAKVLKYRMLNSEEGLDNKPSILFCGMDSYQKRDLHSEAKKAGYRVWKFAGGQGDHEMSLPLGSFEEIIFFVLLVLCVFVANPFSITDTKNQS